MAWKTFYIPSSTISKLRSRILQTLDCIFRIAMILLLVKNEFLVTLRFFHIQAEHGLGKAWFLVLCYPRDKAPNWKRIVWISFNSIRNCKISFYLLSCLTLEESQTVTVNTHLALFPSESAAWYNTSCRPAFILYPGNLEAITWAIFTLSAKMGSSQ